MNRNLILAIFGSVLGLLYGVIFIIIYLFQEFSLPVSNSLRLRSALLITALIYLVVIIVWFRKEIYSRLKDTYDVEDGDDETTE